MSNFGVNPTGFIKKEQTDIESSIETYLQTNLSSQYTLRRESDTASDQLAICFASELADLWEVAEAEYYANVPSFAQGVQLDDICELNYVERIPALKTVVNCTIVGNEGTVIPIGSIISVYGSSLTKFENIATITIPASGSITEDFYSIEYGEISVSANTLTVIETPVSGWATVNNTASQHILGRDEETDAELRIRRENETALVGQKSYDAIKSGLYDITGVESVNLIDNKLDGADGEGRPGHSFEVITYGGNTDDIAQLIWDKAPPGIAFFGTTTSTATDEYGRTQTVLHTLATEIPIYIDIEIEKSDLYPSDGDAQIKANIVAFINALKVGDDVKITKLYQQIYAVTGVDDVNVLEISLGVTLTTSDTNDIVIGYKEVAVTDTDKINITYTV